MRVRRITVERRVVRKSRKTVQGVIFTSAADLVVTLLRVWQAGRLVRERLRERREVMTPITTSQRVREGWRGQESS